MDDENKENINQEENYNKCEKKKSWWKTVCLKPSLMTVFIIIFVIFTGFYFSLSYADNEKDKVVPKFDPKDPNPKPGLYRVEDMNYARDHHLSVALNDGRVLIIAGNSRLVGDNTRNTVEIFDPKTSKFTKLKMNLECSRIPERNLRAILLNNGNVLIIGGMYFDKEKSQFIKQYQIFNPKTNEFTVGPVSTISYDSGVHMWDDNDGNIYISSDVIEKYDIKTNTINEIIPPTSDKYNTGKYTIPRKLPMSEYKYIKENLGFPFEYISIAKDLAIVTALSEIDYGKKVDDFNNGVYKTCDSWYSPMYLINFRTKEIKPLNEFVRSAIPSMVKIKGKNQILITGGCVPKYVKNPDKPFPYEYRINLWTAMKATKHAYILVY